MKRYLTVLIVVVTIMLVGNVLASPPPAHGGYLGGWGMNPTNWNSYSGSFSAWGLYDPLQGTPNNGGDNWVIGYNPNMTPIYITYAPISLDLWIEMYALSTYHYTSYQWHRLGNQAEHICFLIEGTVQSNHAQLVRLMQGSRLPDHLWFIEDMFGRTNPGPLPPNYTGVDGADLELAWRAQWGRGLVYGDNVVIPFHSLCSAPQCLYLVITEPCDHWFQFEGCFDIPYHQPDGYYMLDLAGCPAPVL